MFIRWLNTDKRRYYLAHLSQDLFGDWQMVRAWGSLDSRMGRVTCTHLSAHAAGVHELDAIARRRAARGYCKASIDDADA